MITNTAIIKSWLAIKIAVGLSFLDSIVPIIQGVKMFPAMTILSLMELKPIIFFLFINVAANDNLPIVKKREVMIKQR